MCTCARDWQPAAIAASRFLEMSAGHNQDLYSQVLPAIQISCHEIHSSQQSLQPAIALVFTSIWKYVIQQIRTPLVHSALDLPLSIHYLRSVTFVRKVFGSDTEFKTALCADAFIASLHIPLTQKSMRSRILLGILCNEYVDWQLKE